MLRVALYTSKEKELEGLEEALMKEGISGDEIEGFLSAKTLLDSVRSGKYYDFYILFPEDEGLALAEGLRALREEPVLIFVSESESYTAAAYRLRVCRYLYAPLEQEELREALGFARGQVYLRRLKGQKHFSFRTEAGTASIPFYQILYVELNQRVMRVHLGEGAVLHSLSLRSSFEHEAAELLDSAEFSQVHKSYIVNLRHVQNMESGAVFMDEGSIIPVSRRNKSRLFRDYLNFQARQL